MRRIKITDNNTNSRGFGVLTAGISLERYYKNPVLLWMHQRGTIIGQMRDVRVEDDGSLTAEPFFDDCTDLSKQLHAQYEAGSLRAASMGIDVLEVQEVGSPQGELTPVVTRSSLYEVSLVDVPENPGTVTLRHQGADISPEQLVTLAKAAPAVPYVATSSRPDSKPKTPNNNIMNLQQLALLLGLDEGATEEQVTQYIKTLLAHEAQHQTLTTENASLREQVENITKQQQVAELAHVSLAVQRAVDERRITADKRDHFIQLGKKIGSQELLAVLSEIPPVPRITETLQHSPGNQEQQWKRLSDVPPSQLLNLRKQEPERYARLYEAEYGIRPEVTHD